MAFLIFSQLINLSTGLFIGLWVLFKNYKDKTHRHLSFFTISVAFWSFAYIYWQLSITHEQAYFWSKLLMIGANFAPLFYFTFVIHFIGLYHKRFYKFIYWLFYIIAIFFFVAHIFTKSIVANVEPKLDFPFWPVGGSLFIYFLIYFFGSVVYSSFLVYRCFKNSIGVKREQSRYVLLGMVLAFIGGSTNYFLWFDIPIKPWLTILVSAYPLSIAYAIVRYRLMDIKLVFRRSTVIILSILFTTGIVFVIGGILFYYFNYSVFVLMGISSILSILFYKPVNNYFKEVANQYLFSSIYNSKKIIKNLADSLTKTLELKEMSKIFVSTLIKGMNLRGVGVFMVKENFVYPVYVYHSALPRKLFWHKFENFLKKQKGIWVLQENLITSDPLEKKLISFCKKRGVALIVPLYIKDKLLGFLVLKNKISKDPFFVNDIEMISTISKSFSIAMNNALLYKEVVDFNKELKRKVKEQTKDIVKKNEKLKRLLALKSEFLDIASHQLRTPITVIIGILELFEDSVVINNLSEEKRKELWNNLKDRANSLRDIVNDILRASEFDSEDITLKFHPVELLPLIVKVRENLKPLIKDKDIKVIIDIKDQDKKITVLSVEDYLVHVITNLLSNAFKYTLKGKVTIKIRKKTNFAIMEVIDTGIGIPKKEISKLFKKFSRASNARELIANGSGLGLFIVKKIIDLHPGGQIWVKSKLGKGSTFGIKIPLAN